MKILLLGKNGQLGWELQRSIAPLGELIALGHDDKDLCSDLTNLEGLAQTIRTTTPSVIVNAAAYTAVDKAETDRDAAHIINAQAPAVLAEEAKKCGALLVHYSTDYVFNGSGEKPWNETDTPAPLNVYGTTKLEGEKAIQASGCRHLIFRTSWVYAARGKNFVKTILRLAAERDRLTVINDQTGAPTGADLLADVTAHALRTAINKPETEGLYHLAAKGEASWYDFARFIVDSARKANLSLKIAPNGITPIQSSDYPTPAPRPHNSRLNTAKLEQTFSLRLPNWQDGVQRMLTEITEK